MPAPWSFIVAVVLLSSILSSCGKPSTDGKSRPEAAGAPWFEDITVRRGVNFAHQVGTPTDYFMPASVGSGIALFDYDGDERLDIYFIQNAGPDSTATNQLFHQENDGRFNDVSVVSGLDVAGRGMGVAIGDVTNDGLPDVLVTEYSGVRLFLNEGRGKFREVTKESGLDNPFWATSAAFLDLDRDGWLDLAVVNYVAYDPTRPCFDQTGHPEFCGPKAFTPGTVAKLFRNLGNESNPGVFEDITVSSGLGAAPSPGLGVVCADFDGDRWPDIFIANDGQANRLWMNQHDGTFKDEAIARGVAFNAMGQPQGNMGIALGDVDGDDAFDVFVTHLTEETHALWTQGPRGVFQERTPTSGLAQPRWHGTGFGTAFGDFDNNGSLDVAIANGDVRRSALTKPDAETIAALGPFWAPYAQRNQLFGNDGKGQFRDLSPDDESFCGAARVARGLACGDLDNDGALDLAVSNVASAAGIYRNVAPQRGHWLLVRAIDPALGGRDAYGAEISVVTDGQRRTRWLNPAASYLSSNDPRAHFGLRHATYIEAIEVLWPDGATEVFPGGTADRQLVLRRGEGKDITR